MRLAGLPLWAGGQEFPPASMHITPGYFHRKTEDKYKKEIPSCLIPCLLVVFTRQLEILVKTLDWCVLICLLSQLPLLL